MRSWKCFLKWSLPLLASTLCYAVQADRITGTIDGNQMVALPGQVHRKAQPKYDQGRVSASLRLNQVTLLTLPTPAQQRALDLLLAEQQNPKSPNFHKWLTPEGYADRFGLSPNDLQKITAWLGSQGLSVSQVARARNWIVFAGTVAQVEKAFRTEMHQYQVDGRMHIANATAPSVPSALANIVVGFQGLDDFHPKPANVKKAKRAKPNYYDGNYQIPDFMAPGDIATIYDINTLYNSGIDGTGQKMVIVGQTDVYQGDLNAFRTGFGLPTISCTTNSSDVITSCNTTNFVYVLDGGDPGVSPPSVGDLTEADLDLEWSAATARNAQIIFVNSTDVFVSYYYAIDQNLAPVISMSYGAPCEFDRNQLPADETELKEANSLGITFMNSSGDSGAASCDSGVNSATNNLAVGGLAVSYPASSPEVTAVGGTAVSYPDGFSSTYWGTTNGSFGDTAQNPPIPETAWNDDVELGAAYGAGSPETVQEQYAIVSSGGGVSNCAVQTADFSSCVSGFAQPSWQTVTISGQTAGRFVPDVSLNASPNFPGYVYCTPVEELSGSSPYDTETTSSCGTGTASDMQAAVNGICSGACNGNNTLVGPSLVGGTSASSPIFAGIVTLLNQYLGGTGLGNINSTLYTLAAIPGTQAFHQITTGSNIVYCEGATPSDQPVALQCPGAAGSVGTIGYQASNADSTTGYNLVTGLGSIDANALFTAWAANDAPPDFSLSATSLNPASVSAGSQTSSTITISPISGSTGTVVNFSPSSCTGLPAGATCTFNPSSVTFNGTSAATTIVTISTAANMALPSGAQTITIVPTGSPQTTTTVSLTVTATTESYSIAAQSATYQVISGGSATVNLTVSSTTGFINNTNSTTALPLIYSCTGTPNLSTAEISCTPPNNGQATNAASVTVTIKTTAPTTELRHPFDNHRIFYAMLLPGLFGIMLVAGGRKRGATLLGMIIVLGCFTLGAASCGGGNSGGGVTSNPGTQAGNYTVTINATTGGANPLMASTQVTLNVSQ